MGNFVITVKAVGGHGCQRTVPEGGTLMPYCGVESCPDCKARAFVMELSQSGTNVESATLTHWPDSESQVVDDLRSLIRGPGQFAGAEIPPAA
jgi:hypothetical protein